jgi:hypothetical protein
MRLSVCPRESIGSNLLAQEAGVIGSACCAATTRQGTCHAAGIESRRVGKSIIGEKPN